MLDLCKVWVEMFGKPDVVMSARTQAHNKVHELQVLDAGHHGLRRLGSAPRRTRTAGDER